MGDMMRGSKSGSGSDNEKRALNMELVDVSDHKKESVTTKLMEGLEHVADDIMDVVEKVEDKVEEVVTGEICEEVYLVKEITDLIEDGAKSFLAAEYRYCMVFIIIMSMILALSVEVRLGAFWTTISFAAGALTSILAGYIGMRVAVFANGRVALQA